MHKADACGVWGHAQYLDVSLRARFVTAADTTGGMHGGFGQSCLAEQSAYYLVRRSACAVALAFGCWELWAVSGVPFCPSVGSPGHVG